MISLRISKFLQSLSSSLVILMIAKAQLSYSTDNVVYSKHTVADKWNNVSEYSVIAATEIAAFEYFGSESNGTWHSINESFIDIDAHEDTECGCNTECESNEEEDYEEEDYGEEDYDEEDNEDDEGDDEGDEEFSEKQSDPFGEGMQTQQDLESIFSHNLNVTSFHSSSGSTISHSTTTEMLSSDLYGGSIIFEGTTSEETLTYTPKQTINDFLCDNDGFLRIGHSPLTSRTLGDSRPSLSIYKPANISESQKETLVSFLPLPSNVESFKEPVEEISSHRMKQITDGELKSEVGNSSYYPSITSIAPTVLSKTSGRKPWSDGYTSTWETSSQSPRESENSVTSQFRKKKTKMYTTTPGGVVSFSFLSQDCQIKPITRNLLPDKSSTSTRKPTKLNSSLNITRRFTGVVPNNRTIRYFSKCNTLEKSTMLFPILFLFGVLIL
ncbi:uncharacterized protein RJT20DRAFT_908 [Scheffersomyces xylosifermentans]|uniref:uncharacterized protein n=1 Tax=Scheffersomyces xylosifermentans TaxID=1304137 RepID=UPI00315D1A32